jgi:SAM-dependent methyltransferase
MGVRPGGRRGEEVAIGTGCNLPHYPEGIRLTGVDLSPTMLELARRRADQLGLTVELRSGDAQALELPDASFDMVVCTLSLCAIPDQRAASPRCGGCSALAGGCYCWTMSPPGRGGCGHPVLLEQLTRPLGGEQLRRRPLLQVQAEGFTTERHNRARLGIVERLTARKPPATTQPRGVRWLGEAWHPAARHRRSMSGS